MPARREPFITDQVYHICNRGIDHKPTYTKLKEYKRAFQALQYYRYESPSVRLSKFLLLSKDIQEQILSDLQNSDKKIIDLYAYCFMPNHVHFLIKQLTEGGISEFIGKFFNSYTKYFNTINKKEGPFLTSAKKFGQK